MTDRGSVLIVEDDAISALYLRKLLSLRYRVAGIARNGEEAIALADKERPDVVIMDVHLDGAMDGVEAARRIRESRAPRIVFCSAYSREDIGDPVGKGIGDALIAKPIHAQALLDLLGSLARS